MRNTRDCGGTGFGRSLAGNGRGVLSHWQTLRSSLLLPARAHTYSTQRPDRGDPTAARRPRRDHPCKAPVNSGSREPPVPVRPVGVSPDSHLKRALQRAVKPEGKSSYVEGSMWKSTFAQHLRAGSVTSVAPLGLLIIALFSSVECK